MLAVGVHRERVREPLGRRDRDAAQHRVALAHVARLHDHAQVRVLLRHLAQALERAVVAAVDHHPDGRPCAACLADGVVDLGAGVVARNQDEVRLPTVQPPMGRAAGLGVGVLRGSGGKLAREIALELRGERAHVTGGSKRRPRRIEKFIGNSGRRERRPSLAEENASPPR
jgi:hypothetical protein